MPNGNLDITKAITGLFTGNSTGAKAYPPKSSYSTGDQIRSAIGGLFGGGSSGGPSGGSSGSGSGVDQSLLTGDDDTDN